MKYTVANTLFARRKKGTAAGIRAGQAQRGAVWQREREIPKYLKLSALLAKLKCPIQDESAASSANVTRVTGSAEDVLSPSLANDKEGEKEVEVVVEEMEEEEEEEEE